MRKWLRDNGLSIALFLLFSISMVGHVLSGWLANNDERQQAFQPALPLAAYLHSGAFVSSVFENWESEFLQMGFYVVLTAYLFQRGSPESKDPDKPAPQDRDPTNDASEPEAPWPVRAGGLALSVYSHSLGIALGVLFGLSFLLHLWGSTAHAVEEAREHHKHLPTVLEHLRSAGFWFESFQNWQSEFLSTGLLIVLSIFLRERGSPESKPVAAPHARTGTEWTPNQAEPRFADAAPE